MYVHTYSIASARRERGHTQTHSDTHLHTRRYWGGAVTANPPQSRAPPGAPPAQGATSDQASLRLQIRSALSPLAGSGDPPSEPSIPAWLRAAAPQPEGPKPPSSGSRGLLTPALGPHHPSCYSRTKPAREWWGPKVPCVPTRRLLVFSRMSGRMHPGVSSCMPLALRCPLSRPTLPRGGQRSVSNPGQAP